MSRGFINYKKKKEKTNLDGNLTEIEIQYISAKNRLNYYNKTFIWCKYAKI